MNKNILISFLLFVCMEISLKADVEQRLTEVEEKSEHLIFQNIPLGESTGVVLRTKAISIRGVPAPFNASIIENGSGYLLFFRYDEFSYDSPCFYYSNIGCVELDANFDQTEKEFKKIDTSNNNSEDPRVVKIGDEIFLSYISMQDTCGQQYTMRIALLNLYEYKIQFETTLDLQIQPIEKKWTPFEYINSNNQSKLYFEYYLCPHTILKIKDPRVNSIEILSSHEDSIVEKSGWPSVWGEPRGGASPRKIGNQYLGFFHSSFEKQFLRWYVMGAYTFEEEPPFFITAVSPYPILFKGIYNSPLHTARPGLRCIFPCGFAIENRDGRDLIHVALWVGEELNTFSVKK